MPRFTLDTNSLHHIKIVEVKIHGRSVGLELTLDDFQNVSDQVPFLADLKPSGKYVMEDVHKVRLLTYYFVHGILNLASLMMHGVSYHSLCPNKLNSTKPQSEISLVLVIRIFFLHSALSLVLPGLLICLLSFSLDEALNDCFGRLEEHQLLFAIFWSLGF